MSVKINSLTATPRRLDSSQGEQEVVVSWDAKMDAASDNPTHIELNIHPDSWVFFVSDKNKNEKTVAWNQDFNIGNDTYNETVVIIVTKPQTEVEVTKLRIDSLDSKGVKSSQTFSLLYK